MCPSLPEAPPADAEQDAAANVINVLRENIEVCRGKMDALKACVSLK